MRPPAPGSLDRIRANTAEAELADAERLIAELHDQLTRANAAAVRMARKAYRAGAASVGRRAA